MNYYFTTKTFPEFWNIYINQELSKFLREEQIEQYIDEDRKELEEVAQSPEFIKCCQEAYYVGICALLTHPLVKMQYKGFDLLPIDEERLYKPHSIINAIGEKFVTDNIYTPFIIPGTNSHIMTDHNLAKIRVCDYFQQIGAWDYTGSKPL